MGCSAKVPTGPDWKSWCRAQNLQWPNPVAAGVGAEKGSLHLLRQRHQSPSPAHPGLRLHRGLS